jgi:dephospho-CoA kinase
MEDLKLAVLVGMPGAGKSFCIDYLIKKGLPSVYFGGITINEVKARGLDVTEANEKIVREDIRAKEGKDAYAKRIITQIEKLAADGHKKILVDGLYSWSEYKIFKQKFGNQAVIIAVAASRQARHGRLANRPVRPLTDEEVTAREYAEIENLEKGGPIANADYTLVNDNEPDKLLVDLSNLLNEIGFSA